MHKGPVCSFEHGTGGVTGTQILGIDPGIARMGYGIVEMFGNRLRPVIYGCIETPAHTPDASRLAMIYEELSQLIEQYQPSVMAVEELFFNRNTTTAFTVGQARGIALLVAAHANMETAEYTPMQVKQAVVGYGKADKTQVQEMVRILLNLESRPKPDDTADALAIAITHAHVGAVNQKLQNQILQEGTAKPRSIAGTKEPAWQAKTRGQRLRKEKLH